MRAKNVQRLALLVTAFLLNSSGWAASWNIGVLAMRGEVLTRSHWQPLEVMLNQQLTDQQFHIQPLDLQQMQGGGQ